MSVMRRVVSPGRRSAKRAPAVGSRASNASAPSGPRTISAVESASAVVASGDQTVTARSRVTGRPLRGS